MSGASNLPKLTGIPPSVGILASDCMAIAAKATQSILVSQGPYAKEISSTWGTETSSARAAEISVLQRHVENAAGVFEETHGALGPFQTQLAESNRTIGICQQDWDDAEAEYRRRIAQINAEAAEKALTQSEVDSMASTAAANRDEAKSQARRRWRNAAELVDIDAGKAAATILAALGVFVPLASRSSSRGIESFLSKGMPLNQDAQNWQHASREAEAASKLLDDYRGGDREALKKFNSRFGDLPASERAYFELALAQKLGANGFHKLVNDLYQTGAYDYLNSGDYPDDVTGVMQILSGAFITRSGDPSAVAHFGPGTHARYENGLQAWLNELATTGPNLLDSDDRMVSSNGFWMQAQLLGLGADGGRNPGDAYFDVVGKAMLEYDASINSFSGDPKNLYHMGFAMMPSIWADNPPNEAYAYGDDPMHAFLRSAAVREGSTHGFLLNEFDYAKKDGTTGSMGAVEYLVGARDAQGYLHTDQTLIGKMVEDYGTSRGENDAADVELASKYLSAVTETLDRGTFEGIRGGNPKLPGGYFGGARTSIAEIMSSHIDAFVDSSSSDFVARDGGYLEIRDGTELLGYKLVFEKDLINKFDALYGELALDRPEQLSYSGGEGHDPNNPPALERVLSSAMAYNQHMLANGMAGGEDPSFMATHVERNVEFVNRFINASEATLTSEADKDHLKGFLSAMAKGAAGKVPVATVVGTAAGGPAGGAAGFVVDQAWKYTAGQLIDGWADQLMQQEADNTAATHDSLRVLFDEAYVDQAFNAAMETNTWVVPEHSPGAWISQNSADPSNSFADAQGNVYWDRLDPDSPTYSQRAVDDLYSFRAGGSAETGIAPYIQAVRDGIVEANR